MIQIELVPFLEELHALYEQPRGFERFSMYLDMIRSSTGEMALPIAIVNPMAKAAVRGYVARSIDLQAERIVAEAALEAAHDLAGDDRLRVVVLVVDDAGGGWTNRAFAEFAHRYERHHEVARGWVTVALWTSEQIELPELRASTRESLFRTLDERHNGSVRSLREILLREGRAMEFAGRTPRYDDRTIASIGERLEAHMDSCAAPVVMAALYGDEIAAALGYSPLGVPERGGYELALVRALHAGAFP